MNRTSARAPLTQAEIDAIKDWPRAPGFPTGGRRAGDAGYEPEPPPPPSIRAGRTKLALVVLIASLITFGGALAAGYLASRGLLPWQ